MIESQQDTLDRVRASSGLTVSELAKRLRITYASARSRLERLVESKHLRRESKPAEHLKSTIWYFIALMLVCLVAGPVEAQPRERMTDRLALARICVSEAGFTVDVVECAAIYRVLRHRAAIRHMTFQGMARAYSRRVFELGRTGHRAWVSGLRQDARRPVQWPATPHPPWSAFEGRWWAVLSVAEAILAGVVEDECSEQPDHWGAPNGVDLERALRAGWTRVDCGPTRNYFWRI